MMPSRLLSNFNVGAFGNSYPRALRIQGLFSHKSLRTCETGINTMATSGDLMVDSLVYAGCRNLFGFAKPRGVVFSDRSRRFLGGRGRLVYNSEQMCSSSGIVFSKGLNTGRAFTSSCHSDGSFSVQQISSVAVSAEQYVFLFTGLYLVI